MSINWDSPGIEELGYLIAEASRNVVFVVGAGMSMPAGLPSWQKLNETLKKEAVTAIDSNPHLGEAQKQEELGKLEVQDPWLLGDALKAALPIPRYRTVVRQLLTSRAPAPAAYEAMWHLNPSGVISFNLDNYAAASLGGMGEQVATALDHSKYLRFLLLNHPFVFQPHGRETQPESWVLGMEARTRLLQGNTDYRRWLSHVFSSRRLVILGFRPSDFAFESLLLEDFRGQLHSRRVDHFWVVPDPKPEDELWAKNYHLRVIPYTPEAKDHPEVLQLLTGLSTFKPRSPAAGVVYAGESIGFADLPEDEELRKAPLPDIRARLNAALKGETDKTPDHDVQLSLVTKLLAEYSASAHMAWLISPGANGVVWGYRVIELLGTGGFARVWKVEDSVDGQQYAMKVLHQETIAQVGLLEAFRRGVRAMRLLNDNHVEGIVKYERAFDIPACVVMEFIDGTNFEDAVTSSLIENLDKSLSVVVQAARIVLAGHGLDKQVLHRDLKPANVMLRHFYAGVDEYDVVVLDFDLSWHEGAAGRSVVQEAHPNNYVAPEQVTRRAGASSRHTAVDVYGIGMLTYFASVCEHPVVNVQSIAGFRSHTAAAIAKRWPGVPHSIPVYLSMVIETASHLDQARRPSLPVLIAQLESVLAVLRDREFPVLSDLINLEIAMGFVRAGWQANLSMDTLSSIRLVNGECAIVLGFVDLDGTPVYRAQMSYSAGPSILRSRLKKYGEGKRDRAAAILKKDHLFSVRAFGEEAISLTADTQAKDWGLGSVQHLGRVLVTAASQLAFSEK